LDGELRSREVLRLPNCTGYLTLRRSLGKGWWMQYNQILSGAMWTTRTDAQTAGELMLVRSPAMGQHDLWIEKMWKISPRLRLATETACQNLLNNYQKDLSVGSERDASYLYGPSMPRRISVRLRLMG
jgi:outer membrane receptor for ferrienterochelin and colicins